MISAKEAAVKAEEYFRSIYEGQDIRNILVEEIELVENRKFWLITLGFSETGVALFDYERRKFKKFKVNAETSEVIAMKIRVIR